MEDSSSIASSTAAVSKRSKAAAPSDPFEKFRQEFDKKGYARYRILARFLLSFACGIAQTSVSLPQVIEDSLFSYLKYSPDTNNAYKSRFFAALNDSVLVRKLKQKGFPQLVDDELNPLTRFMYDQLSTTGIQCSLTPEGIVQQMPVSDLDFLNTLQDKEFIVQDVAIASRILELGPIATSELKNKSKREPECRRLQEQVRIDQERKIAAAQEARDAAKFQAERLKQEEDLASQLRAKAEADAALAERERKEREEAAAAEERARVAEQTARAFLQQLPPPDDAAASSLGALDLPDGLHDIANASGPFGNDAGTASTLVQPPAIVRAQRTAPLKSFDDAAKELISSLRIEGPEYEAFKAAAKLIGMLETSRFRSAVRAVDRAEFTAADAVTAFEDSRYKCSHAFEFMLATHTQDQQDALSVFTLCLGSASAAINKTTAYEDVLARVVQLTREAPAKDSETDTRSLQRGVDVVLRLQRALADAELEETSSAASADTTLLGALSTLDVKQGMTSFIAQVTERIKSKQGLLNKTVQTFELRLITASEALKAAESAELLAITASDEVSRELSAVQNELRNDSFFVDINTVIRDKINAFYREQLTLPQDKRKTLKRELTQTELEKLPEEGHYNFYPGQIDEFEKKALDDLWRLHDGRFAVVQQAEDSRRVLKGNLERLSADVTERKSHRMAAQQAVKECEQELKTAKQRLKTLAECTNAAEAVFAPLREMSDVIWDLVRTSAAERIVGSAAEALSTVVQRRLRAAQAAADALQRFQADARYDTWTPSLRPRGLTRKLAYTRHAVRVLAAQSAAWSILLQADKVTNVLSSNEVADYNIKLANTRRHLEAAKKSLQGLEADDKAHPLRVPGLVDDYVDDIEEEAEFAKLAASFMKDRVLPFLKSLFDENKTDVPKAMQSVTASFHSELGAWAQSPWTDALKAATASMDTALRGAESVSPSATTVFVDVLNAKRAILILFGTTLEQERFEDRMAVLQSRISSPAQTEARGFFAAALSARVSRNLEDAVAVADTLYAQALEATELASSQQTIESGSSSSSTYSNRTAAQQQQRASFFSSYRTALRALAFCKLRGNAAWDDSVWPALLPNPKLPAYAFAMRTVSYVHFRRAVRVVEALVAEAARLAAAADGADSAAQVSIRDTLPATLSVETIESALHRGFDSDLKQGDAAAAALRQKLERVEAENRSLRAALHEDVLLPTDADADDADEPFVPVDAMGMPLVGVVDSSVKVSQKVLALAHGALERCSNGASCAGDRAFAQSVQQALSERIALSRTLMEALQLHKITLDSKLARAESLQNSMVSLCATKAASGDLATDESDSLRACRKGLKQLASQVQALDEEIEELRVDDMLRTLCALHRASNGMSATPSPAPSDAFRVCDGLDAPPPPSRISHEQVSEFLDF
jgi:hypothetical protein